MRDRIIELEKELKNILDTVKESKEKSDDDEDNKKDTHKHTHDLKPLTTKDIKTPTEFNGSKDEFLMWHENFTTMLLCRTPSRQHIVDYIKECKDQRIKGTNEVKEAMEAKGHDKISENIQEYQTQLSTSTSSTTPRRTSELRSWRWVRNRCSRATGARYTKAWTSTTRGSWTWRPEHYIPEQPEMKKMSPRPSRNGSMIFDGSWRRLGKV